jgi:outer membrane lipoprotein-sorting protein
MTEMNNPLWLSLIVLRLISGMAAPQSGVMLNQVFAKLDEASKTFHAVDANIQRTYVTPSVNDTEIKFGKMYYVKTGKEPRFKLEFSKPQTEYVLIDKGKLQIYIPKIKQVQEAATAGHEDTVEMVLALGFGQTSQDLRNNFDITLAPDEVVDGQKRTVLDLKPKSSAMFKSMRMWLDEKTWHAVQIKATETTGNYLIVQYSNIKMVPSLPNSRFQLDLPKDVKIIKL